MIHTGVLMNGSSIPPKDKTMAASIPDLPGKTCTTIKEPREQSPASSGTPSCFPPEMRQRGVSQQRYEADMAAFHDLRLHSSSDDSRADFVCCATLGLSRLLQVCCCLGGQSELRSFVPKAMRQCDDMNVYYGRHGIRWYVEHTPGLGATISYELRSC